MEYSLSYILMWLGNLSVMIIQSYFLSSRRPPAPGMVRLLPAGHGHSRHPGLDLVPSPVSQPCPVLTATTCQGGADQEQQTSDNGRAQG